MTRLKLHLVLVLLVLPTMAMSSSLPWYAGVSVGASMLRPDTENSAFTLDSNTSASGGAFIGYDFSQRFSLEAGYHNLGSATLSSANGKEEIAYSALSAGALMYVLGDADDIAERNGFSAYVRLGLSAMRNKTDIPLEKADNMAIWAGAGFEWPFSNSLSLRGELTSFDGDAQAAQVSVLYRPRASISMSGRSSRPTASAPEAPRRQAVTPAVPQTRPAPPTQPALVPKPLPAPTIVQPKAQAPQAPGGLASGCRAPTPNEPSDAQGCALFSGPLRGVEFASGTATLTQVGGQLLDRLAGKLIRYPSVVVEIQAHTESFGNAGRAKDIARQRTLAVARYLAGKGVPVARLRARAFGHTQPLTADNSAAGRRKNNRVELRVLQ